MSRWFEEFLQKTALKKEAIDKLPPENAAGILENDPAEQGEEEGGAQGPGAGGPPGGDPMGGGQDMGQDLFGMPGMPPPEMIEEEETPIAFNNKYTVKTPDGIGFVVQFNPKLVTEEELAGGAPGGPGGATGDPMMDAMKDKTYNPNSDPEALLQWLQTEKNFNHSTKGTVDPLSKQEEGISPDGTVPVHQLTKTQSLKKKEISKKAGAPNVVPGMDRSNPYAPCSFCSNYIAATNECRQGLDVEKVQAAKSCSWLNSSFSPFKQDDPQNEGHEDGETFKSDISQSPGFSPSQSDQARMTGNH